MSPGVSLDHEAEMLIMIATEKSNPLLRLERSDWAWHWGTFVRGLIVRGDPCYCESDIDTDQSMPRLVSSKFGAACPLVTWCPPSVTDQHQPTQWHHAPWSVVRPQQSSHQPGPNWCKLSGTLNNSIWICHQWTQAAGAERWQSTLIHHHHA